MGSIELRTLSSVSDLVAAVHETDEPVVIQDGESECLVAMRPSVLERILFDTDLLNRRDRSTFYL